MISVTYSWQLQLWQLWLLCVNSKQKGAIEMPDFMEQLVGLSFSGCVRSILEGRIQLENVALIISDTRIDNWESYCECITIYKNTSWHKFNWEQIRAITDYIWDHKLLFQPRLYTNFDYGLNSSILHPRVNTGLYHVNWIKLSKWELFRFCYNQARKNPFFEMPYAEQLDWI